MSNVKFSKKKKFFLLAGIFLGVFLLIGLLFTIIYLKVKSFYDIPSFIFIFALILAALLSALFIFLIAYDYKRENRISWFIKNHYTGIILIFAFLTLFIGSISNGLAMDYNKASDLVNVSWTIYAISIGAFAVWHALVFMRIINSNKGKYSSSENKEADEYDKRRTLIYKSLDHMNIVNSFEPVVYICLNTLTNIVATGMLYFSKEYQLVQETAVICAFLFSTNTLIDVLCCIIFQLYKERKALLKETEVNYSELNDVEDHIKAKEYMEMMEEKDKNKTLTHSNYKDQKKRVIMERTIFFLEQYKKDKDIINKDYKEIAILSDSYYSAFKKPKNK